MPVFRYNNRQDVYYELYGKEGDPVLTICNGLSMRTSHWAPYFELLPKQGVRVLAYDMLGQGQSSKPILGVDFDDHARILNALHEHLGIRDPYVLGISFGGVVVLKYAYMFPERIKGLIPVSTFSELDPQLWGHACNLFTGIARVGFEFYLDLLMPLNFTNEWMAKNEQLLAVIKRVGAASNELYGIQNLMESLKTYKSITADLHRIQCPTLILNGEYDALTPRHLHDIIRREIKNSRMMIIQKMCHAFTLEIPQLTARILAEFVRSVEDGSWKGDQSVWIANEDPNAKEIAFPYPEGDHLRFLPLDGKGQPVTAVAKPAPQKAPARKSPSKPATKSATKSAPKAAGPAKAKPASKAAAKPKAKPAAKKAPAKKAEPAKASPPKRKQAAKA